jgi:integrase
MATLPRGVQSISYKDKQTKRITIKYRVQVRKASFQVDRLFDSEADAIAFWEDTRTPEGRLAIAEGTDRTSAKVKAAESAIIELMTGGGLTVGQLIDGKIRDDYQPIIDSNKTVDKDRRTAKVNRDRLKKIKTISVQSFKEGAPIPSGKFAALQAFAKGKQSQLFGDFELTDLNPVIVTNYIRSRLGEGIAKSTIKREIGAMQSLVNKIEYRDQNAWKRLKGVNPFNSYDKSLLKGGVKRRRAIITKEQEDSFVLAMSKHKNPEYSLAFAIAMITGMRRAEILSLKFSQVDFEKKIIVLDPEQTKDGADRVVFIDQDVVDALLSHQKKARDDNVFRLTIEGFKTGFQRLRAGANLSGVNFHDTRRTVATRLLREVSSSSIRVAEIMGAKSVRNFEETTLKPIKRMMAAESGIAASQQDVMDQLGHRKESTTQGYIAKDG